MANEYEFIHMKNLLVILVIGFIATQINAQKNSDWKYFGQTPPRDSAVVFAPGIISLKDRNEAMISFSPDGKACYFTVCEKPWNKVEIMETVFNDTAWIPSVRAPFIETYAMSPSVSADGNEFFFIGPYKNHIGVNQCFRTADGTWSAPIQMDSTINSESSEYGCHISNLGTLFICSWRPGGVGGCDGWRIPKKDGLYQNAENLGALNSKVGDCLWAPGPNEDFLIFQSRRPALSNQGGFFETDLFITFAMPDGSWSVPQKLGDEINSSSTDGFAWVTHDGKYLFFASDRSGMYDIYWVSLDTILKNTPKIAFADIKPTIEDYAFFQIYDQSNTIIGFDLKVDGNIKLDICNLEREKMKTIFEEYKPAGENQFVWEAEGFDKGEYLCKMQVSDKESGDVLLESVIQILVR